MCEHILVRFEAPYASQKCEFSFQRIIVNIAISMGLLPTDFWDLINH